MAKAGQHREPTPAGNAPAKAGLLRRCLGWLRARPLRAAVVISLLAVGIIGFGVGLSLVFRANSPPAFIQQLAQAFAEFDKGNREDARRIAAKLLRDTTVNFADYGGAYLILGDITLRDAEEQINPAKRQVLGLVAARYLDEARIRGVPQTRQTQTLWLLGRALYIAGNYDRSIPILREALAQEPKNAAAIHSLLAECYLSLQPARLAEALEHNRQYLATPGLTPAEQDAGRLAEARILLVQKEFAAAQQTIAAVGETSAAFPEAVILRGRVFLESLAAAPAEPANQAAEPIAAMQEELRRLLGRVGLPAARAAQAQLLIGLFHEKLGDTRAAIAQFDVVRRNFFGQPEALAAIVFHGDLLRPVDPREAVALYKRVLSQLAAGEEPAGNAWLPPDQLRARLVAAIDDLAARSHFAAALELAEALVLPAAQQVALERRVTIERAWARQLEDRAKNERLPEAAETQGEARRHWRQAGVLGRELAHLRIATRFFLDDLAHAADDFRRGQGYEQAAIIYRELLRQEPQQREPDALVGLGESLLALGQTDAALAELGRCREAYPKHPATYQARLLSSLTLEQLGQLKEAQALLNDNLYQFSLAPQSTEWRDSLFALGAMLYRSALDLESRSRLAGVDRLDAESRRAGLALLEQSQAAFDDAIRTLAEAVERYPGAAQTVEALYCIAESHRHSAKWPRKRLASVTIETSKAALTRQLDEQLQAAIDGYNGLIARLSNQQHPHRWPTESVILRNCYFGRADALFDLQKYDEAIQAYSAATNRYQHDPEALEAYVQIASCHRRQGRISEARGTLEQARVVLQRIRPDADFTRTTRLARKDWSQLLDWLRTM